MRLMPILKLKQKKDDEKADFDLDGGCSIDDVCGRFASASPTTGMWATAGSVGGSRIRPMTFR